MFEFLLGLMFVLMFFVVGVVEKLERGVGFMFM